MVQLSLAVEDAALLHEVLDTDLIELRREIRRTESTEFREALEHREEVLERLLQQLDAPVLAR